MAVDLPPEEPEKNSNTPKKKVSWAEVIETVREFVTDEVFL